MLYAIWTFGSAPKWFSQTQAISFPLTWTVIMLILRIDWNMSKASDVAAAKPCFSSVPTGSNIRTFPGQIVRHEATHSSFLPAFHRSACLAACASRARRLGTLLMSSPSWPADDHRRHHSWTPVQLWAELSDSWVERSLSELLFADV